MQFGNGTICNLLRHTSTPRRKIYFKSISQLPLSSGVLEIKTNTIMNSSICIKVDYLSSIITFPLRTLPSICQVLEYAQMSNLAYYEYLVQFSLHVCVRPSCECKYALRLNSHE